MALEKGTKLGPYRIHSPIGAGGMGEVYLARDTKLDRDVAIKVLPESMARDRERLLRFEREAKLLASFNHSNIAAIHGFEDIDGTNFLVLEYVEGETLAQRLKHGPLSVEESLDTTRQIAEALEAAHEKGVIHRDLKPGNVMVRPDGTVKVLDFGLAKAIAEEPSVPAAVDAPTVTADHTKVGVVLGTAAYMSPEQARGRPVDKHTDIWSLGCVLFECLSGKRTFEGATITDLLAQIVSQQPDFDSLPDDTPGFLLRFIRRCLEKDPRRRLRDVGELRFAIEEFQADSESELIGGPPVSITRRRPVARLLPWTAVVLLGVVFAYSMLTRNSPLDSPAATVARWSIPLPSNSRVGLGDKGGRYVYSRLVAISPDGTHLSFVVKSAPDQVELYTREMNENEARPIPGSAGARAPFFSPDGQWLGFLANGILKKVALARGSPQKICDVGTSASFDASWAPDGETIVFATDAGLWRVSASGGPMEQLTKPQTEHGEVGHHFPRITSDGQGVLFTVAKTPETHVALLSLHSRTWNIIVRNASHALPLRTDRLLFARSGELLVAPFDTTAHQVRGSAVPVLQGVHTSPGLAGVVVTHFDVSDTGTLAYIPASVAKTIDQLLWVDQTGNETVIAGGAGTWVHPRLSPDGRRVSVDIHSPDGMRDVYIYELERAQLNRLTNAGVTWESLWRPDGKYIAIMSGHPPGRWSLSWTRTDFSGPAELLVSSGHAIPASWFPDGRSLLFYEHAVGGIWMLSPEGNRRPELVMATSAKERWPMLSPDGKWMAYVADESGHREVFVQSFPDLGPKYKVSIDGGGEPVWSRDGRKLFFREGDQMIVVDVEYEPAFSVGAPKVLFTGQYDAALIGHQHYDVSLDGEKFLMIKHGDAVGPSEVRVVLNWFEELNATAPSEAAR